MVLRLIRDLPGEAAFLAPVVSAILRAGVAPGSPRQDHTTSPYAAAFRPAADADPLRNQAAAPEIAASIASCAQRIVTIAKRPSSGRGRRIDTVNQNYGKAEYFYL
jgi:hypothetical protein